MAHADRCHCQGREDSIFAREHPPPHFHAVFAEYRAQVDIRTLHVLRGSLPLTRSPSVGITNLLSDGVRIKSQVQYYGRIVRADPSKGTAIEGEGVWSGKTIALPPHTGAFHLPIRANIVFVRG
jgi:hypothetical protein